MKTEKSISVINKLLK